MPHVIVKGLRIEYLDTGERERPAILLIMGLGMQLTAWPEAFCSGLAERGFRLVRFDNRDVGLSTKIRKPGAVALAAVFARALAGVPPYSLHDMAGDALGLMDALGIEQAHIVGLSMGGMIGQIIAAEQPARALSLTSIMSSSGDPRLPRGDPRIMRELMRPRQAGNRERAVRQAMEFYRLIGSPGFPTNEPELRAKVERSIDRCYYPMGFAHHMLAIMACGSRVDLLRRIRAPSLVVHGTDDPLVPLAAGQHTAAHIPGAELKVIRGMGHDLPPGVVPILVAAIADHCRRALERLDEAGDPVPRAPCRSSAFPTAS